MTTVEVPEVFVKQLGAAYLGTLLQKTAELYNSWEFDASKPKPSVLYILKEVIDILTCCTEKLQSISDSSPRDAIFDCHNPENWDEMAMSCADEIICNNFNNDDTMMPEICKKINEYAKGKPNIFYDTFYQFHFDKFCKQMGYVKCDDMCFVCATLECGNFRDTDRHQDIPEDYLEQCRKIIRDKGYDCCLDKALPEEILFIGQKFYYEDEIMKLLDPREGNIHESYNDTLGGIVISEDDKNIYFVARPDYRTYTKSFSILEPLKVRHRGPIGC